DGTCGPVAVGTDPKNACADSGALCDLDGTCDGAGSCAKYQVATGCALKPCASGNEGKSGFCADGVCFDRAGDGPCRSCSKAAGAREDGRCSAALPGSDDAKQCTPYGCNIDGTCKATCGSVDDCATPTICSDQGRCEATAGTTAADDGCGCHVP